MAEKRPFSIYAHAMNAMGTMLPNRKYPLGLVQSTKVIVETELARIGFTIEEIRNFASLQEIPPPGLIEEKVQDFHKSGSKLGDDRRPPVFSSTRI